MTPKSPCEVEHKELQKDVVHYKSTGDIVVNNRGLSEDFPNIFPAMQVMPKSPEQIMEEPRTTKQRMTPKSPEEIVKELEEMLNGEREVSKYFPGAVGGQWLRSSLASVLLWATEEMPEDSGLYAEQNKQAWQLGVDDCRSLLIKKAREIVNDSMQELLTEERIREAAKESAEDQAEMMRKAKEIAKE